MITRFYLAAFFLLLLKPAAVQAQRDLGVDWEVPEQESQIASQLRQFSNLGISHIQISQHLDTETWALIDKLQFRIYGQLPVRFPVVQTVTQTDSSYAEALQKLFEHYKEQPRVRAIGIFAYGALTDTAFQHAISDFINGFAADSAKSLYYVTARATPFPFDSLFNFKMLTLSRTDDVGHNNIGAFLYRPEPDQKWDLAPVKQVFDNTAQASGTPLFFNGSWLQMMINKHPGFAQIIRLHATSADPIFPLPKKASGRNGNSIIVILLLLAWFIFASAYNYNPIFRQAFFRYFTGHDFYIGDVMERHIRNLWPGISILLQHCIAGGIIFYCLSQIAFSELGREALFTHFPIISVLGTGKTAIFFFGFFFTLFVEIISITWLLLANAQVSHLSQIINLYPWPLQLNLITATLIIAFFLGGGSSTAIYLLSIVFLILFISSFTITSFDTAHHITSKRFTYFAGTTGMYIAIWLGLTTWVLYSPVLQNVITLAISLP